MAAPLPATQRSDRPVAHEQDEREPAVTDRVDEFKPAGVDLKLIPVRFEAYLPIAQAGERVAQRRETQLSFNVVAHLHNNVMRR